jgi:hypothetical protein
MAAPNPSPSLSPVSSRTNGNRPSNINRAMTAPPESMAVNGHFASMGQNGTANFENGVQVIDEEKEFKYVPKRYILKALLTRTAPI